MNPAQQFLSMTPQRRALTFEQAAIRRAVDSVIIEKDFWVCWLLGMLFSQHTLAPHVVFKGGTSLSKVFGVIDRFSEDVDLSVSPAFVGVNVEAFEALNSRTQRDAAMAEMQRLCSIQARDTIAPALEAAIRAALGASASSGTWLSYEQDAQAQSPILYFHYPTTKTTGLAYVRRTVKLELGSLTDQQPVGQHSIRPWVAEEFPAAFIDWQCEVTALELSRSFWEKATILHAEYHRPENQPMPDRYARHYSDLACLLKHANATTFIADKALCQRVVNWKSRVFSRGWARYDLAQHGSFKLVPPDHRLAALANDYAIMRPMFLSDPPPFSHVIKQLADAEKTINAL
ncbi:MAG: nucleotidyl transferase AbiEii/AbiGii toxin family protein [Pseudomonadota bacterium]